MTSEVLSGSSSSLKQRMTPWQRSASKAILGPAGARWCTAGCPHSTHQITHLETFQTFFFFTFNVALFGDHKAFRAPPLVGLPWQR